MNTTNEQEPVAWMTKDGEIYKHDCWPELDARPLVFGDTTPPAAQPAQISPKQLLALAQTASLELDKVIEVFRMAAQPAPVRDVPDGWKLVPVEPTDEMLDAAQAVVKDIYRVDADCVYLAMLNSAPEKGQP